MKRVLVMTSAVALLASLGGYLSCASTEEPSEYDSVALALSGQLSGAIFTTTEDGSVVNANLYPTKEDVYLDGGPGPNAPAKAAGLPEGDYYFQVTDPSGKDLLSSDHISCRKVHVNAAGVIDQVYSGTNYVWHKGAWEETTCQHEQGTDLDHSELGAITVQLFPYDDTPNHGGVYKVWMTPVDDYVGVEFVPERKSDGVNGEGWSPGNAHGFIPSHSKTDNYKVEKKGKPCDAPLILANKYHDENVNSIQDTGESEISGWGVSVADPIPTTNHYYTPVSLVGSEGLWTLVEDTPEGTMQTSSSLNGELLSSYPNADPTVAFTVEDECSGEEYEVVYGNVGAGEVGVCKVYDRDTDGIPDEGEPMVAGWPVTLSGTDVRGQEVLPIDKVTGADGCVSFEGLLPGEYTLTESLPASGNWSATGETSVSLTIESTLVDGVLEGTVFEHEFTNVCTGTADFDTKGYWHNKNGLGQVTADDVFYINSLAPYASASSYFGNGDEPFDGTYGDGTPVPSPLGTSGEVIAPAGSTNAELSLFLVDANAGGDPREQLAQQLLAFVLNTQHRLDSENAAIKMPDGSFQSASSLIGEAITLWQSGSDTEQTEMSGLLDGFNNNDAVEFRHWDPCPVE